MKSENGITLIALVVTIVVLMIITGVVTYAGTESIQMANRTAFISEMEMIQAKVNAIYEERKNDEAKVEYYNTMGQDISLANQDKVTIALNGTSKNGFRYFKSEDLKNIDLDNIRQEVLINYDTREVISLSGTNIDGVTYYKLGDIPNYIGHNVEYKDANTKAPTFTVEQTKLGTSEYKFTVKDVVYNSNVKGGTVSYKLHNNENWTLNGENTSFIVYKPGLYDIKFTDTAGNSTITQKWIYVEDGLILYYDGENNTGNGHNDTATTWKDLSGSGNDGIISGGTWGNNYLTFDGVDDFLKTTSEIKLKNSKEATIDLVDIDGELAKNETLAMLFELSQNWNENPCSFGLDTNENGVKDLLLTYRNASLTQYNIRNTQNNILEAEKTGSYSFIINAEKEKHNFFSIYKNMYLQELSVVGNHDCEFSDIGLNDYVMYIASRAGMGEYAKMKLGVYRVYNRVLTEEEMNINYEIDKYRFGIID